MPVLEEIYIRTNAQLWTPQLWGTIPEATRELVKRVHISIDAATSDTYALNRKGGSFERLLENLCFVSSLRVSGSLRSVMISMVVQSNNFREMPDFVRLGKQFNFDTVYFCPPEDWGTFSEEEFSSRAIHLPEHPHHRDLKNLLKDGIFSDPSVKMGALSGLAPQGKYSMIPVRIGSLVNKSLFHICRAL